MLFINMGFEALTLRLHNTSFDNYFDGVVALAMIL